MNQNVLHAKADGKNSSLADPGQNGEARTTKKARTSRHGKSGAQQTGKSNKSMPYSTKDQPIQGSLPLYRWLEESKADAPFYGNIIGGSNHTVAQDIHKSSNKSGSVEAEAGTEIDVHSKNL